MNVKNVLQVTYITISLGLVTVKLVEEVVMFKPKIEKMKIDYEKMKKGGKEVEAN